MKACFRSLKHGWRDSRGTECWLVHESREAGLSEASHEGLPSRVGERRAVQRMPEHADALGADLHDAALLVRVEFEAYLKCGRLEYGFLRIKCDACRHEKLVAFSCKRRGFCPSCGARRMAETAAHFVEHVLPEQPIRERTPLGP